LVGTIRAGGRLAHGMPGRKGRPKENPMKRAHVFVLPLVLMVVLGCAVATVLPDGRVLFVNGVAKIFDPNAGVLRNASVPVPPRAWNTMTLLTSGQVLLAGGVTGSVDPTAAGGQGAEVSDSASLYDPATDTYKPTGAMAQQRILHTATLLQDGKVLVAGGSSA